MKLGMQMKTPGRAGWISGSTKKYRQSGKVSPRYRRGNPRVSTVQAKVDDEAGGPGASVIYRQRMISAGKLQLPSGKWIDPKKVPPTKLDSAGFPNSPLADAMRAATEARLNTSHWQSERRAGYDHWHHLVCQKTRFILIICFISGAKARFVEYDWLYETLRESRLYSTASARELMQVCAKRNNWDRISWETLERFTTVSNST
jgi:hypothetical protein